MGTGFANTVNNSPKNKSKEKMKLLNQNFFLPVLCNENSNNSNSKEEISEQGIKKPQSKKFLHFNFSFNLANH